MHQFIVGGGGGWGGGGADGRGADRQLNLCVKTLHYSREINGNNASVIDV